MYALKVPVYIVLNKRASAPHPCIERANPFLQVGQTAWNVINRSTNLTRLTLPQVPAIRHYLSTCGEGWPEADSGSRGGVSGESGLPITNAACARIV